MHHNISAGLAYLPASMSNNNVAIRMTISFRCYGSFMQLMKFLASFLSRVEILPKHQ